jgi:hypothetical protein
VRKARANAQATDRVADAERHEVIPIGYDAHSSPQQEPAGTTGRSTWGPNSPWGHRFRSAACLWRW